MYIKEIGIIEKGMEVRSKRRGFCKLKGLSIKGINPREGEIRRYESRLCVESIAWEL